MAQDFLSLILDKAKNAQKHIVLPEGEDPRTIEAAAKITKNKIARLTLLGDDDQINAALKKTDADFSFLNVINPLKSEQTQLFADQLYELRKNKGMTPEKALETVKEVTHFGTMMVKTGLADGLVSGAVHSSADTIRPALQIVKSAPGIKTVSSMFFMTKGDQTYLFSDCGLNQNPTPQQLADITLSTANTAKQFGFIPKIAILSYSTKGSGSGPDIDMMAQAAQLASEKMAAEFDGEYFLDGEIQFDAAFVPAIAAKKCPDSPLKGQANIFIFPDLNCGNICYKMAERLAGLAAYGPILQGIAKPMNDLSRGCSGDDIVATIAITAIQAIC